MAINFDFLGGAVSDIFGGIGDKAEAKAYGQAATYALQNAQLSKEATAIQEEQAGREIFKTVGAQQAQVAGAGFAAAGSSLALYRSSIAQGSLQKALIQTQGNINKTGYLQEAAAYKGMQGAANAAAGGGFLGGLIKGVSSFLPFLSDVALKENITQIGTRGDGLNIYTFNYKGSTDTWTGFMAQEVQKIRPDAVSADEDGYLQVDYGALDYIPMKVN